VTRRGQRPAKPRRGPLHAVDDQLLVADLLGPAAARRVDHVPVATLLDAGASELARLGLAPAASRRLLAAAELARRFQPAGVPPAALDRPQDYLPHLAHLRSAPVEILGVLVLDARLALLGFSQVATGALMHVSVTAREVFAPAIERRGAGIVLAHNHPSGDPAPSPDDRAFTQLMVRASVVLGIHILDHLVLTRRSYFSFAGAGLL